MPSIYDIKTKFQTALRPITTSLASTGISANQVTLLALLLSVAAGGSIALFPTQRWPLLLLPVVLIVRMALNAIDGILAREHDMKSSLGAVLNELGDVVSDVVLYLPLALVHNISAVWIVIVVLLSVVSEMAGVVAVQIGAQRRYDGPMGKSDRAFVFGVIALSIGLGVDPQPWLKYVLMAMVFLLCLTVIKRARGALDEVDDVSVG